jgi:uncharacterized protein
MRAAITDYEAMNFSWKLGLSAMLCLGILAGCASLHEKQGDWIFNPTGRSWGDTAGAAAAMQDVWIDFDSKVTQKPVKLHALWHPSEHAQAPVLIYLHGARWNVTGSAYRVQRMQSLGFHVLAVDYRGFGKTSQETPSEDMAYEDAKMAWEWLAHKYPNKPRYIFGHSLGGAIAIELASQVTDEKGTIVEGTFTSIPDVFRTLKWGWLPLSGFISQRFESHEKVAKIGSPLLVVHGSDDKLISPQLGRKLYDAAKMPKKFLLVDGGSHHNTNSVGLGDYRAALKDLFGLDATQPRQSKASELPPKSSLQSARGHHQIQATLTPIYANQ